MLAFSSPQWQGPFLPTCPHSAEICTRLPTLATRHGHSSSVAQDPFPT